LRYTPLAWGGNERATKLIIRCHAPPHQVNTQRETSAERFSSSSNGDCLMPVVPTDHGRVKV
ncbi:MAG: hypothetical protein V3S24_02730, partial [Candidatus Tectomicrobia bacterium]